MVSFALCDGRLEGAPNLTLNLGLRYELTPPIIDRLNQVTVFRPGYVSERFPKAPVGQLFAGDPDPILGTVPRGGYPTDTNNLAPRLGLAYSPNCERGWLHALVGNGRTSIRIGLGLFYGATFGANFSDFSFVPPFNSSVFLDNAPDSVRVGPRLGSFSHPFANSGNPFPIGVEGRGFDSYSAVQTTDPAFRTSYSYHYNLSIQRELPWSLLAEAGYVGKTSFKTERQHDLNPTTRFHSGGFGEPYPYFIYVTSQESSGRARFDALELRLSRRFKDTLFLDGSYTFSKALDNASGPRSIGAGADEGRAARSADHSCRRLPLGAFIFDRRHSFAVSYVYTLPRFRIGRSRRRLPRTLADRRHHTVSVWVSD